MTRFWFALAVTSAVVAVGCAGAADSGDESEVTTSDSAPDEDDVADSDSAPDGASLGSALDDMADPSFPEPLVDTADIISGGPPPDGIPPIDFPKFEVASDISWIDEVEPVLMLELGGETRAYPIQLMTWHEIVNDSFGDTAVTISYCPLCNSAVAYLGNVDGRILDFGTSGRLYNSSLVMYDRQTESLWTHFDGQAVVGALTGIELETVPVTTVSWATFRDAHPEAMVLSRDTGFDRNYGTNPYPGYDDVTKTPFLFTGEVDGRLAAQTRVVVVRGETESVALPLDDLAAVGTITTTIDGEEIVFVHEPGTASALDTGTISEGRDVGTVGVYRSELDDVELKLELIEPGRFADTATGTTFDVLGRSIDADGSSAGAGLRPVEHLDTFWFAIAAFEPDTRIIG